MGGFAKHLKHMSALPKPKASGPIPFAVGPNTVLNPGSGGDTVRDIDLGSAIKVQVMLTADPVLVVSLRATFTTAQTNTVLVANSAGTRLAVTQAYAALAANGTANASLLIGFGASTTPTTIGVVLSHSNLPVGQNCQRGSGAGIIGTSADGIPLLITCGAPTGGAWDVIISYMPLPTAGM